MLPLAIAALTTAGHLYGQQRQETFQREMSNTAARRSVADYKAAGLNPALAYDRTASSPPGVNMGGAIEAGINTGMSFREHQMQQKWANDMQAETVRKLKKDQQLTDAQTRVAEQDLRLKQQQERFGDINQPADTLLRQYQADIARLQIPGLQNTANWETRIGELGKGLTTAKTLVELFKLFRR